MNNHYAPCFYRIDFVVISSYIELPWFTFPINDLFFQLSIRFKVDQINKAINFSKITFTSIENFHKCLHYFKC